MSIEIDNAIFESDGDDYQIIEELKPKYLSPTAIIKEMLNQQLITKEEIKNIVMLVNNEMIINNTYNICSKEIIEIRILKTDKVYKPFDIFIAKKVLLSVKFSEDVNLCFQNKNIEAVKISGEKQFINKDKETGKPFKDISYMHKIIQIPTPKPKPIPETVEPVPEEKPKSKSKDLAGTSTEKSKKSSK